MDYYAIHFYNYTVPRRIVYQREYLFVQDDRPFPADILGYRNEQNVEQDRKYMLFVQKLRLNSAINHLQQFDVRYRYDAELAKRISTDGKNYLNELKRTLKL